MDSCDAMQEYIYKHHCKSVDRDLILSIYFVFVLVSVSITMNEFSQTSLKGQGLLLLEQGIARVCSIGELVL